MDCGHWIDELVECARRGERPAERLEAHLRECLACRERWAAEQSLSEPMRRLRTALAGERMPEARRRQLMAEFGRVQQPARQPWPVWAAGLAATVLMAALVMNVGGVLPVRNGAYPSAAEDAADPGFPDISAENGFVEVPFAGPLAAGESVRIVREEMDGAELAAMGFDPPGGFSSDFDADVVLGEDGLPRAVHLIGYDAF